MKLLGGGVLSGPCLASGGRAGAFWQSDDGKVDRRAKPRGRPPPLTPALCFVNRPRPRAPFHSSGRTSAVGSSVRRRRRCGSRFPDAPGPGCGDICVRRPPEHGHPAASDRGRASVWRWGYAGAVGARLLSPWSARARARRAASRARSARARSFAAASCRPACPSRWAWSSARPALRSRAWAVRSKVAAMRSAASRASPRAASPRSFTSL